jgi:hypothetical protein
MLDSCVLKLLRSPNLLGNDTVKAFPNFFTGRKSGVRIPPSPPLFESPIWVCKQKPLSYDSGEGFLFIEPLPNNPRETVRQRLRIGAERRRGNMAQYSNGQTIQIGDRILWGAKTPATIVFVLDDEQFSPEYPREEWILYKNEIGKVGVKLDLPSEVILDSPEDFVFVAHAENNRG